MRVVFVLTTSLESPYGLGRCFPLARELARLGHDVHIVALHHNFQELVRRFFVEDNVHVHYVGQMHVLKHGDTTEYFTSLTLATLVVIAAVRLAFVAGKLKADVYHLGKPHPQNAVAGLWAARLMRKRRLFLDCDDYEAQANRFSGKWQQRGVTWLENNLPRIVDGITVNTSFLGNHYSELGINCKVLHLPNGVDTTRFCGFEPTTVEVWRQQLELVGKQVILYVGTISLTNHSLALLLQAFAYLVRELQEVILVIAGGGADLPKLKVLAEQLGIAQQCRFLGRVPSDKVTILFRLADVSVDPVYDDAVAQARWPLKIMESLASGVPVVTGDVGDRRQMLGENCAGLLVKPGNAHALAEGLLKVLRDDNLRSQLKTGCAVQARLYSFVDLARQLIGFYQE